MSEKQTQSANDSSLSKTYDFESQIENFGRTLDSVQHALPGFIGVARLLRGQQADEIEQYGRKHGTYHNDDASGTFGVSVPVNRAAGLRKLDRRYHQIDGLAQLLPRTAIVALVSIYDAYLGYLIRGIFQSKPEILDACQRTLTFSELTRFGSIETARDFIIEKEVESVLRKSHAEHFEWLETRLGIPLRKGLDVWPDFIEVTERRNLLVHADGVTSSQYLQVCKAHGVELAQQTSAGDRIEIDTSYLTHAYRAIFEIGFKLGIVVWCKVLPNESEQAETVLNNQAVELVNDGELKLALKLFEFPFQLPLKRTETMRLLFIINQAMTHKWLGDDVTCEKLIGDIDWSALADKFQFAHALLRDDFDSAATIMRRIGSGDAAEVSQSSYHDWPILRRFRNSPQFASAYRDVFGEDYKEAASQIEQAKSKHSNGIGEHIDDDPNEDGAEKPETDQILND